MNTRQLNLPECGSAMLTLSEPLTQEAIYQLECGFDQLLFKLRQEIHSDQPDPGDLEFKSWTVNMHLINH